MSFAHDIVMCNDTITTTQPPKDPTKNSQQQTTDTLAKNEKTTMQPTALGSSGQANNQQVAPAIGTANQNQLVVTQSTERDYKDPLRELVLISEAICINDTAYLTNVKSLAKEASVLEHVKEVLPEQAGQMPVLNDIFGSIFASAIFSPNTFRHHQRHYGHIRFRFNRICRTFRQCSPIRKTLLTQLKKRNLCEKCKLWMIQTVNVSMVWLLSTRTLDLFAHKTKNFHRRQTSSWQNIVNSSS